MPDARVAGWIEAKGTVKKYLPVLLLGVVLGIVLRA